MKKNSFTKISTLEKSIIESINLKKKIFSLDKEINKCINILYQAIKRGNKVLFCGNGGSASDAQHLVAELLIRLKPKNNRNPIPAISLAMDTSTLTACGNDFDFKHIFSRPFKALVKKGDILIAITTSGNSKNIIEVLKIAKKNKIKSIGFLGNSGGLAKKYCDIKLVVPSKITARIQETHIFLGHYILENVEKKLFKFK